MAVLYVAEYAGLAKSEKDDVLVFQEPPLREQTIAIGATTTPLALPFLPQTNYVEISTDSVCSIAFASGDTSAAGAPAPVATVTNCRMNSNERIVRRVGLNRQGLTTGRQAQKNGKGLPIMSVAVILNT